MRAGAHQPRHAAGGRTSQSHRLAANIEEGSFMRSISVRGRFVLAAVSWLLGCGAAGEDPVDALEADDLGTMEQALNASCGSASPQATYTARVNPSLSASAAQQSAGCQ